MTGNANQKQELVMSFDPQTIEHLGAKMYSQLPNAIAELIAVMMQNHQRRTLFLPTMKNRRRAKTSLYGSHIEGQKSTCT